MAYDPGRLGMAFSPIPGEETLEDLPSLLARLFGGPSEGLGVKRLPALAAKGVPPDEILRAFLAARGGAVRPDITQVFGPEKPAIVEQPSGPITEPLFGEEVPTPTLDDMPEGPQPGPFEGPGGDLFGGPVGGEGPTAPPMGPPPSEAPPSEESSEFLPGPLTEEELEALLRGEEEQYQV